MVIKTGVIIQEKVLASEEKGCAKTQNKGQKAAVWQSVVLKWPAKSTVLNVLDVQTMHLKKNKLKFKR